MGHYLPAGPVLTVLRLVLFAATLWFSALQAAPPALAGQEMCGVPSNVCGCVSCGCPGGSLQPTCPAGQVLYDCPSSDNLRQLGA
jgi:hypothetical protein